jgi:hypothetical protein
MKLATGNGRRRLRILMGLALALTVAVAAVAAVAVALGAGGHSQGKADYEFEEGSHSLGGAAHAETASPKTESMMSGERGAQPSHAEQPVIVSKDKLRASEGKDARSSGTDLAPAGPRASSRAKVVALERAAGFVPRNVTRAARIPYRVRIAQGEALPCTSPAQPTNFEIFSAGPSVAGLPLEGVERRCGGFTPADEPPANFVNYIYGSCEIEEGADGCAPPLEIQTWPACERALADYSYEGKPLAYRQLPSESGAVAVEILWDGRIEVYTKASTVVIFSEDRSLAETALTLLQAQEEGQPPATSAGEFEGEPEKGLAPPVAGATEGGLSCRS